MIRKILYASLLLISVAVSAYSQNLSSVVKPGIEVLRDNDFQLLKGKHVGLITNPTGVDRNLRSTADILAAAKEHGVTLAALFAPEHGIRGDVAAGGKVASGIDAATGVKVYSLYGSTKRPSSEMLRGLDVLVYDIQDNGCRSYTFISTMAEAMEAAADAGIEFMVLDRPNPLGGNRVEGGGVDDDCRSFVSALNIPYIYGLTPGELAGYIRDNRPAAANPLKLTVVPMEGWTRSMLYDETGLPWVLPSPHIPEPQSCLYYPASGMVGEIDFFSIGVGYTIPFQTFAAPWIDAQKLSDYLNAHASQDGAVAWRPIYYKPYYSKFKGENLAGVQYFFLNPEAAMLTRVQFDVMEAVAALWPERSPLKATETNASKLKMFDRVVGTKKIRPALLKNNYSTQSVMDLWTPSAQFIQCKPQYHLYK